jgi:hypothetical protein
MQSHDMGDKKTFSVRLPLDTAEEIEQYAEERDISRADALRRAIDAYFVQGDPDTVGGDGGGQESTGAFARLMPMLSAVLLGSGLVLLVTELRGAGVVFSSGVLALAAVAVGFDDQIDKTSATVSQSISEMQSYHPGAVYRYPLAALRGGHPIQEPATIVERVGRWDLYTPILFLGGSVLGLPLVIAIQYLGLEGVVGVFGSGATLLYVSFVYLLFGGVLGMTILSKAAQKALATPDEDPVGIGEGVGGK